MITIKSDREIELMRHAGRLVSEMHKFIKPYIKAFKTMIGSDAYARTYHIETIWCRIADLIRRPAMAYDDFIKKTIEGK